MGFLSALGCRGPKFLLTASLLAVTAYAQAGPQRALLTFNVVAVDSGGAPVRDLQASDLRIYDDGKLMEAAFCRPVETADSHSTALGPREFSNRPSGGKSQSTLILFDLLNANFAERGMGWNEVGQALQKVDSADHLYVYLLTKEGTLHPIHALPDAESPAGPEDTSWIAQVQPALDQAMHDSNRLRPWEFQVNTVSRVDKTLAVLRELVSDFSAQLGRKSLVWITHGVPILASGSDGRRHDYTNEVRRLGTDIARSGVALYTVDQIERSTSGLDSADTLQTLAGLTGGQWLSSDSTQRAIQQALSEGPATYQVGYVPPPERWDGKFHKVRLAARDKSTRLRGIEGYFGDPREADPEERLGLAALGGSDDSGVGIRAAVSPSQKVKGWTHFQIRVDPQDLQITPGDKFTGEFAVRFAYYTNEWQPETSAELPIKLSLTPAEHDAVMRDGVLIQLDRPVPAGVRKLRVVVRDVRSAGAGSLTIPLAGPEKP